MFTARVITILKWIRTLLNTFFVCGSLLIFLPNILLILSDNPHKIDEGFVTGTYVPLLIFYSLILWAISHVINRSTEALDIDQFEKEEAFITGAHTDIQLAKEGFSIRLKRLNRNRRVLEKRIRLPFSIMWALLIVSGFGFLIIIQTPSSDQGWTDGLDLMTISIVYAIPFCIWYLNLRKSLKVCRENISGAELDRQLYGGDLKANQVRARRLFRNNQEELRRYYDLNIQQNHLLFLFGITIIIVGMGIALFSIFVIQIGFPQGISELFSQNKAPSGSGPAAEGGHMPGSYLIWKDGFVAVLGVAATILANFVGAVFMKMHSNVNTSLNDFHGRLVSTHAMFFSNVISSDVSDENIHNSIQQKLAEQIAAK